MISHEIKRKRDEVGCILNCIDKLSSSSSSSGHCSSSPSLSISQDLVFFPLPPSLSCFPRLMPTPLFISLSSLTVAQKHRLNGIGHGMADRVVGIVEGSGVAWKISNTTMLFWRFFPSQGPTHSRVTIRQNTTQHREPGKTTNTTKREQTQIHHYYSTNAHIITGNQISIHQDYTQTEINSRYKTYINSEFWTDRNAHTIHGYNTRMRYAQPIRSWHTRKAYVAVQYRPWILHF